VDDQGSHGAARLNVDPDELVVPGRLLQALPDRVGLLGHGEATGEQAGQGGEQERRSLHGCGLLEWVTLSGRRRSRNPIDGRDRSWTDLDKRTPRPARVQAMSRTEVACPGEWKVHASGGEAIG